jgi:hypothetical protein
MNKMAMSGIVEPIAAALVERVYDVVARWPGGGRPEVVR